MSPAPPAAPSPGLDLTPSPGASGPATRLRVRSHLADVEVDPRDVVTFPDGLPGYEGSRRFVLIDVEETAPLKVLHAVEASEPCFFVIDPRSVLPTYRCALGPADRARLGGADAGTFLWLAIVTVTGEGGVTANLRAPVVIDPARMIGRQVLPNAGVYPLRYAIDRPL
jgi:flagellar assembly factor FliW